LQGAERVQAPVLGEELLERIGSERANQLVLEVGDADVEAEPRHVGARQRCAEIGALERPLEDALLTGVAEPGDAHAVKAAQVRADRVGAAHRHDLDALGCEVAAAPRGERFEGDPVADPLDEHDGVHALHRCSSSALPLDAQDHSRQSEQDERHERDLDEREGVVGQHPDRERRDRRRESDA
jgi:hypothetical protein